MNNSIQINYLTKFYNSYLGNFDAQGGSGKRFTDSLAAKGAEQSAEIGETDEMAAVSPQNMTMEEYKQYIYAKISRIPTHQSQAGWHWNIEITDSGFEAMKNNPAYEEYVLKWIRNNFSYFDPFYSSNYSILHFGATIEECYGVSWHIGSPYMQESKNSFWERRAERRKKLKEQYEDWLDKRAMARRWQKEKLDQDIGTKLAIKRHALAMGEPQKADDILDVHEVDISALVTDIAGLGLLSTGKGCCL